jgi:hypothetical protein
MLFKEKKKIDKKQVLKIEKIKSISKFTELTKQQLESSRSVAYVYMF